MKNDLILCCAKKNCFRGYAQSTLKGAYLRDVCLQNE